MSQAKQTEKVESKIVPLIPEQVRQRIQALSHGVLTKSHVAAHSGSVTTLHASKHLEIQDVLDRSRYSLTTVSDRLMHAKKVLGGQDYRTGKPVEIRLEDITEEQSRGALVYKKGKDGKFYRKDAGELGEAGEMPVSEGGLFRNPPHIAAAMIMAAFMPGAFPLNQYPPNDVKPEYVKMATQFFQKQMGIKWVTDDNIVIGYGSNDLVNGALSVVLNGNTRDNGREYILAQKNEYHSYSRIAEKWGGQMVHLDKISKESLEAWWNSNPDKQSKVRAVFFTNPVASTGEVYSHKELEGIAAFVKEKNLFCIVDQIYATSIFEPSKTPYTSIASLPDMAKNTITTWSPSKDLGAVGIRQGYACCSPEFTERMYLYAQYSTVTPGIMNQAMGMAALELVGSPYHESVRSELRTRRDLITSCVREMNENLNAVVAEKYPLLYTRLPKGTDGKATFISMPVTSKAGHSVLLKFHNLRELGMVDRHGNKVTNNLDITGMMMDYGIPLSPLHPSGNDDLEVRFSFSQFGEKASVVPYLNELTAECKEKGIMIDPRKLQLPAPDPKYANVKTFDEANMIGKRLISQCFSRMLCGLEDTYTHQNRWRQRGITSPTSLGLVSRQLTAKL